MKLKAVTNRERENGVTDERGKRGRLRRGVMTLGSSHLVRGADLVVSGERLRSARMRVIYGGY
jgi:hypothetical protein